ncbi:peptidylprolyl isomerase [Synechococcus sp. PCC 7336]|uniref:peptidylprolyl isomerase n=1 Tax=Synechococcus sp. PCC 7336 TaxID=195250 RepID=UPI000346ADD1|nr:peptidylprolyl isomerase [Synechococcus sp. PCC 7336]
MATDRTHERSRWISQTACRLLVFCVAAIAFGWGGSPAAIALPQGNAITDSHQLLRMALPFEQKDVRKVDSDLSAAERDIKRIRSLASAESSVRKASRLLARQESRILAAVPEAARTKATADLAQLQQSLESLDEALGAGDRELASDRVDVALAQLETFEQDLVAGFPFEIPSEYDGLPRLLGRAEAAFKTTAGRMVLTLDGYNAPLSAGAIADLVERGFYDGLPFDRVEQFYLIQLGDPPGPEDGFIDPATGAKRTLPLEIRARGQEAPFYGETFDMAGFVGVEPMLPFYARGTLAMARYEDELNSASSQFFIFLAEPELTPAGLNLLDGNYSTFGYVTDGLDVLDNATLGDRVIDAELISGSEALVHP